MSFSTISLGSLRTIIFLSFTFVFWNPGLIEAQTYHVTGFTEEIGSDLGVGGYAIATAATGKQCRATFTVSAGFKSITKTYIKGKLKSTGVAGLWGKPKRGTIHSPNKDGSSRSPTMPSSSTWQIVTNNHNGARDQDGTWTVILSFPSGKGATIPNPCKNFYDGNVKVEFDGS